MHLRLIKSEMNLDTLKYLVQVMSHVPRIIADEVFQRGRIFLVYRSVGDNIQIVFRAFAFQHRRRNERREVCQVQVIQSPELH